jgi:hypothetical protein
MVTRTLVLVEMYTPLNTSQLLSTQYQEENVLWNTNKSDNWSLISADRNNKATLLLTILRCTCKSYAKDLSPRIMTLLFVGKHTKPFR